MSSRRHRLDNGLVAAALALLAAMLGLGGWTWPLDRLVYDHALRHGPPAPPRDVVIVAIDDASLESIGRWPWSRAVHATLLEQLARAHPRAMALDLVLSEPDTDPRQDALLARALSSGTPVVLPVTWRADDTHGVAAILPAEPLRRAARLGTADPSPDADGLVRHAFLQAGPADQPWPHTAQALLWAAGAHEAPGLPTVRQGTTDDPGTWQRQGRFAIRFAGPPGTVRTVSYADVLRGAVAASEFTGKYVLVGATAQGLGDRQRTAVDGDGPAMSGIEIIANVLATLQGGGRIVEVGWAISTALFAAGLLVLVAAMTRVGPRRALALALLATPAAVLLSFAGLAAGVWIAPAPFALAALLAYPLWSWRRLERTMASLDREIAALGEATAAKRGGDAIDQRLQTLREAGDTVRQARAFLAEANAALPTAMLVADDAQRILLANGRAAALFEVADASELVGLHLGRLLQELATPDARDWTASLALLPQAGDIAVDARMGDAVDLMVHATAIEQDASSRFIVTLSDIGKVRQAEREREEALAFVSHDLRSPAASIVLLADLNLQQAVATPREDLLRDVRQLASRTLELADAFVRASHAGHQPLDVATVSLASLVGEATQPLVPQGAARGIAVQVRCDASSVRVDRFLLARALGNLLSNALRHGSENSTVEVRAGVADGRLVLRVADQGPGLTPEQAMRINEGGRGAPVGDERGVGLGLVFVQRVARRHGGCLRVLPPEPGWGAILEIEVDSGIP